jgi:hypothetical protein
MRIEFIIGPARRIISVCTSLTPIATALSVGSTEHSRSSEAAVFSKVACGGTKLLGGTFETGLGLNKTTLRLSRSLYSFTASMYP